MVGVRPLQRHNILPSQLPTTASKRFHNSQLCGLGVFHGQICTHGPTSLLSHENAIFTAKPLCYLTRYKREIEGAAARELLLGPAY